MGGGLMQLVAYGAQDIYLTGNPQITFFKVVYRRHTNFSMEAISQTFNGTVGMGNSVSATISRNGDLVHKMYLEASCGAGSGTLGTNAGSALIDNVELEIGGQKIDKHYGHWMETWAELTEPNTAGIQAAFNTDGSGVVPGDGAATLFQRTTGMGGVTGVGSNTGTSKLYIPLQFWFCRNPGLALPLIALQYHEVKVKFQFAASTKVHAAGETLSAELFADYIYLDTDERRRFAQVSHEYLIEQVQYESFSGSATTMDLNFNHPVKELIWTGGTATSPTTTAGVSTPLAVGTGTYHLKLNGHDRMAARDFSYFTRVQVMDYHTGYGGVLSAANGTNSIAVYSFALKPEEHQPSGTCNFSRIDNAQLIGAAPASTNCNVYAVNYNVLRIMSGMGGLAYSN